MRDKFMFLLFLLVLLVGKVSIAEDKKVDFINIKAGESAGFDGYLFTPEAIVKIYTKTEEDTKKVKLEYENKLELSIIETDRIKQLAESEKMIHTNLLTNSLRLKNEVIEDQQKTINSLHNTVLLNKLLIVGAFIAGSVVTYTIVYYSVGLVK